MKTMTMQYLEEVQKLKNELDALRPLSKEDELRIMQKFRLDWNYHSNNLEGNSLTYGETKALILFGLTAQGKPLKDHFEITGHDEAVKWIMDIVKADRPITENFIRELHKLILKEPYEVDAITPDGQPTKKKIRIGEYKTTPNHVKTKTGEIFRFATPEETPALMTDLINWYREKNTSNPILLSAEFHYKFIRIHPFDDGNGRTARLLMNFILMQSGYPPVIIKTDDKQNYFSALRQADAGILEPFIEYIASNLKHSLEIMLKGAKGLSIEEPDDLDKEIALLEQKLNTVSSDIPQTKSEATINNYLDRIAYTADRFYEKCSLLDKFYVKQVVKILVNHKVFLLEKNTNTPITDFIKKSIAKIGAKQISNINLEYQYHTFKRNGFEEFDTTSLLQFKFYDLKFVLKNKAGLKIEKQYGKAITEADIQNLINTEIRAHNKLIESKIEDKK